MEEGRIPGRLPPMTERKGYADFVIARKRLTEMRAPVGTRDLEDWRCDFRDAFREIPYLELSRVAIGETANAMIESSGTLNPPSGEFEYIRRDIEKKLAKDLAPGLKGAHTFVRDGDLLAFWFCCITVKNEYVTGLLRATITR